jgi:hypothetical protein
MNNVVLCLSCLPCLPGLCVYWLCVYVLCLLGYASSMSTGPLCLLCASCSVVFDCARGIVSCGVVVLCGVMWFMLIWCCDICDVVFVISQCGFVRHSLVSSYSQRRYIVFRYINDVIHKLYSTLQMSGPNSCVAVKANKIQKCSNRSGSNSRFNKIDDGTNKHYIMKVTSFEHHR